MQRQTNAPWRGGLPWGVSWTDAVIAAIGALVCLALGAGVAAAVQRVPASTVLVGTGMVAASAVALRWRQRLFPGMSLSLIEAPGVLLAGAALVTVSFNAVRVAAWMTVSDALLLGASFFLLPRAIFGRARLGAVPLALPVSGAALGVATLLSTFGSEVPRSDLLAGARFTLTLVLTPLLITLAADERLRVQRFTELWILSASANGAWAVLETLELAPFHIASDALRVSMREAGLTVHPNHLALACAIALPVALSRFVSARGSRARAANGLLLAGILCGVLLSGSRAGLIGAGAGVVLLAGLQRGYRGRIVLGVATVSALLVAVASRHPSASTGLLASYRRLSGAESVGDSDVTRLGYYRDALADFTGSPLVGSGLSLVRGAHDIYLQLMQASGVLGLAAFVLFTATTIRVAVALARDEGLRHEERLLASSLAVSIVVWLVIGFVQNQVYDRYLYVPGALIVALKLARDVSRQPARTPATRLEGFNRVDLAPAGWERQRGSVS